MAVDARDLRKGIRGWELRLGLMQLLIVLGAVTGSMLCAFYLGFFSGRSAGYEAALSANISHLPRLPVSKDQSKAHGEEQLVSDVYARLGQRSATKSDNRPAQFEPSKAVVPPAPAAKEAPKAPVQNEALPSLSGPEAGAGAAAGGEAPSLGALLQQQEHEKPAAPQADAVSKAAEKKPAAEAAVVKKADAPALEAAKAPAEKDPVAPAVEESGAAKPAAAIKPAEAGKAAAAKAAEPAKPALNNRPAAPAKPDMLPNGSNSNKTGSAGLENFVREVIPGGWFAQLAAPRQLKDADSLARELKGSGFPVVIEKARVRGEEYFRVLVGPEENREQAERLLGQLRRERYVKSEPFLRKVN